MKKLWIYLKKNWISFLAIIPLQLILIYLIRFYLIPELLIEQPPNDPRGLGTILFLIFIPFAMVVNIIAMFFTYALTIFFCTLYFFFVPMKKKNLSI